VAAERILIVDDNVTNLKLARLLFAGEGYDVRTATDAEEALAAIAETSPRLILMDIQLPGMDGLELTRRLKQSQDTRDIIIVGITAYAMKGDEARIREAGCDDYVAKPIDTRTLPARVRLLLDRAAARTAEPHSMTLDREGGG
jgi:CheY-like chemotaxis protein